MTFSDEIIELLEYLAAKLGIAIDWTSENVMPYLEQLCGKYIAWEIATSVAWLVASVVGIALAIVLGKQFKRLLDRDDPLCIPAAIGAIVFGLLGISTLVTQIGDIIKCVTFPELQIYEYITSLLESK